MKSSIKCTVVNPNPLHSTRQSSIVSKLCLFNSRHRDEYSTPSLSCQLSSRLVRCLYTRSPLIVIDQFLHLLWRIHFSSLVSTQDHGQPSIHTTNKTK